MVKIAHIPLGDFPLLLAPMEDVSDPPFRKICKQWGCDVMFTEFISADALIRDAGRSKKKMDIFEGERPVAIQLFGNQAGTLKEAAIIAQQAKPDFIDINFGCPVKKITCKGSGAALLKDIDKLTHITQEVVKAVTLPVTVKTRLGWDENTINIVTVAERLQDVGIAALSIHGRTRKQLYSGQADWSMIKAVKENSRITIPIFGNGDIDSPEKALEYKKLYGVDGIMVGRASIGAPWIFRQIKDLLAHKPIFQPSIEDRVDTCINHLETSINWNGERVGILLMRRHYGKYLKGLANIAPLRSLLVRSTDREEIISLLTSYKQMTYNTHEVLSL